MNRTTFSILAAIPQILRIVFVIAVTAGAALGQDGRPTVTVTPTAARDVVINPGKGWVLHGEASRHDKRLLAVSNLGYRRFEWADLEPEEGGFNWEPIESFLAGWDKLGKQAAFGVMCLNSHTRQPYGYSTPKWVFDAGSPRRVPERTGMVVRAGQTESQVLWA